MTTSGNERNSVIPHLPPDIIDTLLSYCNQKTRHSLVLSCRDYHAVAIPHLYERVVISTPRQLRCFTRTVHAARDNPLLARNFFHTRSFYYRVSQSASLMNAANATAKDSKLYLSLGDIPGYTSSKQWMFPNLVRAAFDPLPALSSYPGASSNLASFLSNVPSVSLLHSISSAYDKAPCFHALGMTNVQEVHMYHIGGAEIANETDIDKYIGYQGSLIRVYLHLEDHFSYVIGQSGDILSGTPGSQPTLLLHGGQQSTEIVARSLETDLYTREYAEATAFTVFMFAYVLRLPPSATPEFGEENASLRERRNVPFPKLEEVVVELGPEVDVNHNELVRRLRKKIAPFKRRFVNAGTSNNAADQAAVPDVLIRRRGGKTLVLKGSASMDEETWGDLQEWVEVHG